jgi:hypothetical protein
MNRENKVGYNFFEWGGDFEASSRLHSGPRTSDIQFEFLRGSECLLGSPFVF